MVGRADLAQLVATLSAGDAQFAAVTLGFERVPEPLEPIAPEPKPDSTREKPPPEPGEPPVPPAPLPPLDVPLWRFERMVFSDEPMRVATKPRQQGLTEDDWSSPGHSLFAQPKTKPLAPWSRLWPRLRAALQSPMPSREPDVEAYVRLVSRGEFVSRIPCRERLAWPNRLDVWVDRSARLVPFWFDQSDVTRRLRASCDHCGLRVRRFDARTQARSRARQGDFLAGVRGDQAVPVLVLGDLGVYGTAADRAAWQRTGRRLTQEGVRVAALVPSPPGRWSPFLKSTWNAMP